MNTLISRTLSLLLLILLLGCHTRPSPEELLEQAKSKVTSSAHIQHHTLYLWENALKEVDSLHYQVALQNHDNEHFSFNYIVKGEKADVFYINNEFNTIIHADSTINVYSKEEQAKHKSRITQTMGLAYNPVLLLHQQDWQYLRDTVVGDENYFNYFWIENDTTRNGKHIYLEQHIFINENTSLVDFHARKLYHNGQKAQFIHSYFTDYELSNHNEDLAYVPPAHYTSKPSTDKAERPVLLKEGEQAPDFELTDMNGNLIRLSDYRGQKVFINFSMINCGWCKIALENLNQPDFTFPDHIKPIYINPVDQKEDMKKYMDLYPIPFPVIAAAENTGKAYGVSGYPTFFLIDENGIIEKAFMGYRKDFINSLRK